MSRRDRYMKFEIETSIGKVDGSIESSSLLVRTTAGLAHVTWSDADDIRSFFTGLGMRTDESKEQASRLVESWRSHEEARKRRSWRHRKKPQS